jgi:hypothetical protein
MYVHAHTNAHTHRPEYMGPELISGRSGYDGKKVDGCKGLACDGVSECVCVCVRVLSCLRVCMRFCTQV